jgi:GTPase SAR1 family protein
MMVWLHWIIFLVYVRREFIKYVEDFKDTNERICYLRLTAKWFSCTLLNVHAPTNKTTEEVNEELRNLLEQNINQIAN